MAQHLHQYLVSQNIYPCTIHEASLTMQAWFETPQEVTLRWGTPQPRSRRAGETADPTARGLPAPQQGQGHPRGLSPAEEMDAQSWSGHRAQAVVIPQDTDPRPAPRAPAGRPHTGSRTAGDTDLKNPCFLEKAECF